MQIGGNSAQALGEGVGMQASLVDGLLFAHEAESVGQGTEEGQEEGIVGSEASANGADAEELFAEHRGSQFETWEEAELVSVGKGRCGSRIGEIRHNFDDIELEFVDEEVHGEI